MITTIYENPSVNLDVIYWSTSVFSEIPTCVLKASWFEVNYFESNTSQSPFSFHSLSCKRRRRKFLGDLNPNRFAFSAPFLKRTGSTRIAHLPLQFIPAFSRRAIKEALIVLPCPYDSDCVCPWEPYWIRDKCEQKIFLHIQNKSINIYLWRKKKGMA